MVSPLSTLFALLMMHSSNPFLHTPSLSQSTALLFVTNPSWFFYYIGGDMMLYFFQKISRRDFIYWSPLPNAASFLVATLVRMAVKMIADFSGGLQFRHPYELGGIYFSFNLLMTQVSVPVCVYLYTKHYDGVHVLSEASSLTLVVILLMLWFMVFIVLISCVFTKTHRSIFWSFQTGWQLTQSYFLENEGNDERKCK
jgi:hypothetical protein